MEDIHGVDVSWIHQSQNKDRTSRPPIQRSKSKDDAIPTNGIHPPAQPLKTHDAAPNGLSKSVSTPDYPSEFVATPLDTPTQTPTKRPGILKRNSSKEKVPSQNGTPNDGSKLGQKKSSWITSLSSKLSSVQSFPQPQATNVNANGQFSQTQGTNALQRTPSPSAQQRATVGEAHRPYVPSPPKSGGTGFFTNALRRLSTSSQLSPPGKLHPNGGVCPRRVMNIDPNRQRCLLPELESAKLRRVAFCVDVEIAGGPRYKDEEGEKIKSETKAEKNIKERAEGEALKNPDAMVEEKEQADACGLKPEAPTAMEQQAPKKEMTRKKEKKKKSEEERKERKEQKRRKAEESGSIPMVITRSLDDEMHQNIINAANPPPRPLDRPTVDPLRIYRRCCQLRETPILKRITDQLAILSDSAIKEPGVVACLDLTGSRLQLADVVTLSDWLAIVPVRKLILEDSDLNDEGVRVILAGLLAAVTPEFARKRRLSIGDNYEERSGLVEKLSLKNNPKMTKEGWKHICLFLYMCKSIRSLDVSGNNFPPSPAPIDHHAHLQHEKSHCDPAAVFARALSERLGGSRFEELVMGECGLSAHQIRKIVDAVTISGIKRLGLAGNGIGQQALEYIVHYIRSGVCEGLDLGSNDLRDHLDVLGEAFEPTCQLWALSLADCKLDPVSLKPLFPGLLNLQNLRFLDLSHNPELFDKRPSALGLLQKYLPMMSDLRRIHLNNNDMAPNQAIALADVVAECSQLAHISILGNPKLSALASATTEESQEEAVALYASLMAAARVSPTIISIEIDVPTSDNSEIVKALAKQVVAYCIRNMERWWPTSDTSSMSPSESSSEANGDASPPAWTTKFPSVRSSRHVHEIEVPSVLEHLVGTTDGHAQSPNADAPAPDNDYIVGGTGVVKALNYCLAEFKRGSASMPQSGTVTPLNHPAIGAKAKAMSKNLLESARKIRARLQPALLRESKGSDDMAYRRLLFLDNTLSGIIERFEREYPETRLPGPSAPSDETDSATMLSHTTSTSSSATATADESPTTAGASPATSRGNSSLASSALLSSSQHSDATTVCQASDSDSDAEHQRPRRPSRAASDVSLAAKAQAAEEGKVLRIGLELKRAKRLGSGGEQDDAGAPVLHAGAIAAAAAAAAGEEEGGALDDEEHVRQLRETLLTLERGLNERDRGVAAAG